MLAPDARHDLVDDVVSLSDRWGRERLDARAHDAAGDLPEDLRDEIAQLGLLGLTLPERHGGAGLGLDAACRLITALARHDRAVATTVGLHLGLGSRGLVAFGGEAAARLLPAMASGERLGAFAATEPGAGSDLSRLSTRAVLDGDQIRVDGSKIFVTNGGWAGVFTVVAQLCGPDGAPLGKALLALERDDPGVCVGAEEIKLGLRASSTTALHLDGVRVPRWRLYGEPGGGDRQLSHVLAWGRTVMAAGCVGTAEAAWSLAHRHTADRVQFGGPLARHPVVRAQLDDADAQIEAMRCLVARTARSEEGALEDLSVSAKVLCSEGAWELADLAVQLLGGLGYVEESSAPLLLRDARITRVFEGANDVLLGLAGVRLLARRTSRRPLASDGPLGAEADAFAARVDAAVDDALAEHRGVRLLRQPLALHRLGRLSVLLDSTDAAVRLSPDRDRAARWLRLARRRAAPLLEPDQETP